MDPVLVSIEAGVMRITLNRPDKLNAFTPAVVRGIADALANAEADPQVRCLLLTGAGRGFCAGADLAEGSIAKLGADAQPDLGATLESLYNPMILRLRALEKPVVCAVNGVAAGAGANLALACDLVLAARSASFIQAFVKIALVPDAGGSWFLPRLVGNARALGLAMTGEKISAEDAEQWGMIWKCVDDDKLAPAAAALASSLAAGPTRTLGMIKRQFQASGTHSLEEQLKLERDLQREVGRGTDFREGVAAFLEKRKPRFTGN